MVMKKLALAAAAAMLMTTVTFATSARPAYAATKVDCDAVMNEINSGKKAKEVATDLSISTSSVYRCKRHAKAAAKAETKSSMQAKSGKEPPMMSAPSSAMGAPSPAMAAPAAASSPK
jgi:FixJ family two-component response regulator